MNVTVLVNLEYEGTYVFIEDFPDQPERRNRTGLAYI